MRWLIIFVLISPSSAQIALSGGGEIQTTSSTPPPPGLAISAPGCLTAYVGTPFSCTLTATGGTPPYTWAILSRLGQLLNLRRGFSRQLPGGLSLSPAGVISGIPTTTGTFVSSVQAIDSSTPALTATAQITITVTNAPSQVATLPQTWANPHEADLPSIGVVTKTIKVTGGDYPCTLAGLQQSMNDWAAAPAGVWWHVLVDDGLSGTRCVINVGNTAFTLQSKPNATGFIVYESAHPNVANQIVCNHIAQLGNSLAGPTPRNPGCSNDISHMWELVCTGTNITGAAINAFGQPYVKNIVIRDVEITYSVANLLSLSFIHLNNCNTNSAANGGTTCGTSPDGTAIQAAQPSHIGIERSYLHGDYDDNGVSVLKTTVQQAVSIACGLCWLEWNYFEGITRGLGSEGQVVGCTNAQPGVKLAHNFFEGGTETIICGGGPTIYGVRPSDLEIRNNIFTMNPNWMLPAVTGCTASCTFKQPRKNGFEMKLALRLLIDGNLMENSIPAGQYGQVYIQNPGADPSPGGQSNIWQNGHEDVTMTNNVIRHGTNGYEAQARSAGFQGSGDGIGQPNRRNNYINNLIYDITSSPGPLNKAAGVVWGSGYPSYIDRQMTGNSSTWSCTAQRDSAGATSSLQCIPNQSNQTHFGTPAWNSRLQTTPGDLVWVHNCATPSFEGPGTAAGAVGVNNLSTALAGTNGLDPDGLTLVYANSGTPNEQLGQFYNYTVTSYQRDTASNNTIGYTPIGGAPAIAVGQRVYITGLAPDTTASGGWTVTSTGNGTFSFKPAPASSTAITQVAMTAGNVTVLSQAGNVDQGCTLKVAFGAPYESREMHNTFVFEKAPNFGVRSDMSSYGCVRVHGYVMQDNLVIANGTYQTSYGCSGNYGWNSQQTGYDVNTVTYSYNYFSYSGAGNGNNAWNSLRTFPGGGAAPIASGSAGYSLWYGTSGSWACPGATADVTCLGVSGFMNGGAWKVDPDPSDPLTFYALDPSSVYKAGGLRQAHDGTDLGANMNQIRTHMNSTVYSGCTASSGTCGAGPNPD